MNWLLYSRTGLICCVVAAVAAAACGNLMVDAASQLQNTPDVRIPPGWEWVDQVVGYVWLGLFACMGTGSWLAYNSGGDNAVRNGRLIAGLLVVCLLYPVYTLGMQAIPGLIANVIVLVLASALAVAVWPSSIACSGFVDSRRGLAAPGDHLHDQIRRPQLFWPMSTPCAFPGEQSSCVVGVRRHAGVAAGAADTRPQPPRAALSPWTAATLREAQPRLDLCQGLNPRPLSHTALALVPASG